MNSSPAEERDPDEAALTAEMIAILRRKMARDYAKGGTLRDAHPETIGLLRGSFRVEPDLQRRPLLINTARGGVDEADLVRALDEGLISGAGFDVVSGEPPAADNPLLRAASRPNVIVTPHVSWASDEAQQALADQLIDNIESFIAGRPRNLVEGSY